MRLLLCLAITAGRTAEVQCTPANDERSSTALKAPRGRALLAAGRLHHHARRPLTSAFGRAAFGRTTANAQGNTKKPRSIPSDVRAVTKPRNVPSDVHVRAARRAATAYWTGQLNTCVLGSWVSRCRNDSKIIKVSAHDARHAKCAPTHHGIAFPRFCDWAWGEVVAFELSEVLRLHIVPRAEVRTLPRSTATSNCQNLPAMLEVSVQDCLKDVRKMTEQQIQTKVDQVVQVGLFDTLTDNCDRFGSSKSLWETAFATFMHAISEKVRGSARFARERYTNNWFVLNHSIVALDNAKALHCHGYGKPFEAQQKLVRSFWRGWTNFQNQSILVRLREIAAANTTVSSLLISRNPELAHFREMLGGIDHRAHALLQISEGPRR
jgi:hypothetical protein